MRESGVGRGREMDAKNSKNESRNYLGPFQHAWTMLESVQSRRVHAFGVVIIIKANSIQLFVGKGLHDYDRGGGRTITEEDRPQQHFLSQTSPVLFFEQ
jgi:hypothetical protein